jgi:adenine-specific DNA methylase
MDRSYRKRLIEVDLPIKRISVHARREKSIRHGHILTLHIWWARRPLAACRAVICAALWPDPAAPSCPQAFRDRAADLITAFAHKSTSNRKLADGCSQESMECWVRLSKHAEGLDPSDPAHWHGLRAALLDFIADFANWDNSTVKADLETGRALTQAAHEALGGEPGTRPLVVDPFAGGGSIPLEALRVEADAFASDLNPVAVLPNKVVLEYIPKYGHRDGALLVGAPGRRGSPSWRGWRRACRGASGQASPDAGWWVACVHARPDPSGTLRCAVQQGRGRGATACRGHGRSSRSVPSRNGCWE